MQCVAAVLVITRRQPMLVASELPLAIFCEAFAAATLNPTANLLFPSIKTLTKCAVADRLIDLRLNKPALSEIKQVRCYGILAIVGAVRGGKDVAPRISPIGCWRWAFTGWIGESVGVDREAHS
jgi:hypothetical protein